MVETSKRGPSKPKQEIQPDANEGEKLLKKLDAEIQLLHTQRSRDTHAYHWGLGEVVEKANAIITKYERGGGILRWIEEGHLGVKRSHAYRCWALYRKFPRRGNVSLWEMGVTLEEVDRAWRQLRSGNKSSEAGSGGGEAGTNAGTNAEGETSNEAPPNDGWKTIELTPAAVKVIQRLIRKGLYEGMDPDEVVNDLILDAGCVYGLVPQAELFPPGWVPAGYVPSAG
jgi:hypothetical protein